MGSSFSNTAHARRTTFTVTASHCQSRIGRSFRIVSIQPLRLVLTDAFAEPATHSGIVSFAEHPRNQPFFLGLQSLLELLLYKIGIPRVSHRVYEIDAVSQQQLD